MAKSGQLSAKHERELSAPSEDLDSGQALRNRFPMLLLRRQAHARAGLVGNPSDGYHGKTISVIVRNFRAEVVLYEWEDIEIVPAEEDQSRFSSVHELARDVKLHGYYGGMRLLKATIKKFVDYCQRQG